MPNSGWLRVTIAKPIDVPGHQLSVRASVGAIHTDDSTVPTSDLWEQADKAMYHAKHNGGGRYTVREFRRDKAIAC